MGADKIPSQEQTTDALSTVADGVSAEYAAWRTGRWEEIAGPNGKAKVVAVGRITERDPQVVSGIPGRWSTTEAGALTVTAAPKTG